MWGINYSRSGEISIAWLTFAGNVKGESHMSNLVNLGLELPNTYALGWI